MGRGGGSLSQCWLARLAQSWGIKQSVTRACHNRPDNTQLQHPVERSAKAKLQAGIYAGGLLNQCLGFQDLSKLYIS